jgi:hypothetical protein
MPDGCPSGAPVVTIVHSSASMLARCFELCNQDLKVMRSLKWYGSSRFNKFELE